jgi:holo-[acyl-carrier protein] synthase
VKIRQGIDIVKVDRLAKMIESHEEKILDRVFSEAEQSYCEPKKRKFEHYAARFAAKEAFIKALKDEETFPLEMRDIEILNLANGRPVINLTHLMLSKFPGLKDSQIALSLSHERDFAIASVIICCKD